MATKIKGYVNNPTLYHADNSDSKNTRKLVKSRALEDGRAPTMCLSFLAKLKNKISFIGISFQQGINNLNFSDSGLFLKVKLCEKIKGRYFNLY